jgi:hypothetical protein
VNDGEPIVVQLHLRMDVVVHDPDAILDLAAQRLRDADPRAVDRVSAQNTVEEVVAEGRDLARSVASLMNPDRVLEGVPGVEIQGGQTWGQGPPYEPFQPDFLR